MPSFTSQTQGLELLCHKTFLSERTGAVEKKPKFPPFLTRSHPLDITTSCTCSPFPKTPRPIPIALGINSLACAKGYAVFAEGIGLLELLRSLPIKPATGMYPEWVGRSSTADQQVGKKWTTSFLRDREALCWHSHVLVEEWRSVFCLQGFFSPTSRLL